MFRSSVPESVNQSVPSGANAHQLGVSSGWPSAESHQVVISPVSGLTRTIAGVSPMLQT